MPNEEGLTIEETDEAGNTTATYIYSKQDTPSASGISPRGRIFVVEPASSFTTWSARPIVASLGEVFLPSGFPESVSDDYLSYQVYDSLQAFCSSIAGLLSSRAVLQGVGVGNANASPTSALLLHILQDTSGRIATILFAHRVGTALEPECKTYRLAADVFNDIAMILDCLSPMIPAGVMRVSILSTAGVLRALCGVAGGSSKASLSAHFAKWGNLAELNAKDSSQETIISLIGMLVGSVVVSHVTGFKTTWAALFILLACHLALNYAAVRSVQMTSLNRQRANIVFSSILDSDQDLDLDALAHPHPEASSIKTRSERTSTPNESLTSTRIWSIPTPAQTAQLERIFPRNSGALEWHNHHHSPSHKNSPQDLGTAAVGVSLSTFLRTATHSKARISNSFYTNIPLAALTAIFKQEPYLLFLAPTTTSKTAWHASILLVTSCPVHVQLKAWMHALLAARVLTRSAADTADASTNESDTDTVFTVVSRTLAFLNENARFEAYLAALADGGWETDIAALETKAGHRICPL